MSKAQKHIKLMSFALVALAIANIVRLFMTMPTQAQLVDGMTIQGLMIAHFLGGALDVILLMLVAWFGISAANHPAKYKRFFIADVILFVFMLLWSFNAVRTLLDTFLPANIIFTALTLVGAICALIGIVDGRKLKKQAQDALGK